MTIPDCTRPIGAHAYRTAAGAYAARGWHVLPVRPAGKVPCTPRGLKDATTDGSTLDGWWRRWPTANIGVGTGSRSGGLLVVDLDGSAGLESWHELCRVEGPLPRTLTSITGRGGRHLYFHSDTACRSTAGLLADGIDTRAEGGYVVAPPSTHASGHRYAWLDPDAPVMQAPDWLVERLSAGIPPISSIPVRWRTHPEAETGLRVLNQEACLVATTPPGSRNLQLFRSTAALAELAAGGEILLASIWDRMEAAAMEAGLPPREATRTIASGIRAGSRNPRRFQSR